MMYTLLIMTAILIGVFYKKANQNTHDVIVNTVSPVATTTSHSPALRVLQLSDLHLEKLSLSPDRLYDLLKNETFDLLALTGDFLDRPKSIPKLIPYLEMFQKLNPKHGTYAVFGNHDYLLRDTHFETLKNTLQAYGITTMQNENATIIVDGQAVHIIGIDDHHSKKSNVERSYNGVPEEGYRLVLTHDPNIVLSMKHFDFDYLLSGHFHGGQIHWPKPYHLMKFGKLVRLNMIKGLVQHEGKVFYINEGLGQTSINIRVGSRPEITIHEIVLPAVTSQQKLAV